MWPAEVIKLAGLKANKENLQRFWGLLELLQRSRLTVIRGDRSIRGALCNAVETSGRRGGKSPVKLLWHSEIYGDLTGPEGQPGSHWLALPRTYLELQVKHSRPTHLISLLLARQFYASWLRLRQPENVTPEQLEVRIRADRLNNYIGRSIDTAHEAQSLKRAGHQLNDAMKLLQMQGVVGHFEWKKGDIDQLSAVLVSQPGAITVAALNGERPRPPAYVPATGSDLRRWLRDSGLSSADLGATIGMSANAMDKACSRYKNMPLPDNLRSLLVDLRWPSS